LQRRVRRSSIFTRMTHMRASSRSDLRRFESTASILRTIHTVEPIGAEPVLFPFVIFTDHLVSI
jgi:hypothetical protein